MQDSVVPEADEPRLELDQKLAQWPLLEANDPYSTEKVAHLCFREDLDVVLKDDSSTSVGKFTLTVTPDKFENDNCFLVAFLKQYRLAGGQRVECRGETKLKADGLQILSDELEESFIANEPSTENVILNCTLQRTDDSDPMKRFLFEKSRRTYKDGENDEEVLATISFAEAEVENLATVASVALCCRILANSAPQGAQCLHFLNNEGRKLNMIIHVLDPLVEDVTDRQTDDCLRRIDVKLYDGENLIEVTHSKFFPTGYLHSWEIDNYPIRMQRIDTSVKLPDLLGGSKEEADDESQDNDDEENDTPHSSERRLSDLPQPTAEEANDDIFSSLFGDDNDSTKMDTVKPAAILGSQLLTAGLDDATDIIVRARPLESDLSQPTAEEANDDIFSSLFGLKMDTVIPAAMLGSHPLTAELDDATDTRAQEFAGEGTKLEESGTLSHLEPLNATPADETKEKDTNINDDELLSLFAEGNVFTEANDNKPTEEILIDDADDDDDDDDGFGLDALFAEANVFAETNDDEPTKGIPIDDDDDNISGPEALFAAGNVFTETNDNKPTEGILIDDADDDDDGFGLVALFTEGNVFTETNNDKPTEGMRIDNDDDKSSGPKALFAEANQWAETAAAQALKDNLRIWWASDGSITEGNAAVTTSDIDSTNENNVGTETLIDEDEIRETLTLASAKSELPPIDTEEEDNAITPLKTDVQLEIDEGIDVTDDSSNASERQGKLEDGDQDKDPAVESLPTVHAKVDANMDETRDVAADIDNPYFNEHYTPIITIKSSALPSENLNINIDMHLDNGVKSLLEDAVKQAAQLCAENLEKVEISALESLAAQHTENNINSDENNANTNDEIDRSDSFRIELNEKLQPNEAVVPNMNVKLGEFNDDQNESVASKSNMISVLINDSLEDKDAIVDTITKEFAQNPTRGKIGSRPENTRARTLQPTMAIGSRLFSRVADRSRSRSRYIEMKDTSENSKFNDESSAGSQNNAAAPNKPKFAFGSTLKETETSKPSVRPPDPNLLGRIPQPPPRLNPPIRSLNTRQVSGSFRQRRLQLIRNQEKQLENDRVSSNVNANSMERSEENGTHASEEAEPKSESVDYLSRHPELKILLIEFVREILRQKPADIWDFGVDFFSQNVGGPPAITGTGLCIENIITSDMVASEANFKETHKDLLDEFSQFGTVTQLVIPKDLMDPYTFGSVYVEYSSADYCLNAKQALHGRTFGGRLVAPKFFELPKGLLFERSSCN